MAQEWGSCRAFTSVQTRAGDFQASSTTRTDTKPDKVALPLTSAILTVTGGRTSSTDALQTGHHVEYPVERHDCSHVVCLHDGYVERVTRGESV